MLGMGQTLLLSQRFDHLINQKTTLLVLINGIPFRPINPKKLKGERTETFFGQQFKKVPKKANTGSKFIDEIGSF